MICVKTLFGEWKSVSKDQAQRFFDSWYSGATRMPDEDKESFFNQVHIKGAQVINGKVVET